MARIKDDSKRTFYIYKCTYLRKDNVELERIFKIHSFYSVYDLVYTLLALSTKKYDDLNIRIEYGDDKIEFSHYDIVGYYTDLFFDKNIDKIKITFFFTINNEVFKVLYNCEKIGEEKANQRITRKTPILISVKNFQILTYEQSKKKEPSQDALGLNEFMIFQELCSKDSYYRIDEMYSLKDAEIDIRNWFTYYKDLFENCEDDSPLESQGEFCAQIIDEEDHDDEPGFFERIQNMMVGLNSITLNKKEHIKKYHQVRKLVYDVLNSMNNEVSNNIEYYTEKFNQYIYKNISYFSSLIKQVELDYNFVLKSIAFFDVDEKSLVNKYLKNKRFRKEDKIKMLKSLSNFKVGIYEITKVERENAFIYLKNIKTSEEIKIIDEGFSISYEIFKAKELYLVCLSMDYEDITFNEISLPLINLNSEINEYLNLYRKNKLNDFEVILNGYLYEYNKIKDKQEEKRIYN